MAVMPTTCARRTPVLGCSARDRRVLRRESVMVRRDGLLRDLDGGMFRGEMWDGIWFDVHSSSVEVRPWKEGTCGAARARGKA